MYGLPDDFDPAVFVGLQLEAVTFAANVIVLAFSGGGLVSVSGSVPYQLAGESNAIDMPPVQDSSLMALVGAEVVETDLISPRELVLKFDGGSSLTLLDDSDAYECYTIQLGDREIFV